MSRDNLGAIVLYFLAGMAFAPLLGSQPFWVYLACGLALASVIEALARRSVR